MSPIAKAREVMGAVPGPAASKSKTGRYGGDTVLLGEIGTGYVRVHAKNGADVGRAIVLAVNAMPALLSVLKAADERRADCLAERRCGSYPCGLCGAVEDALSVLARETEGR